MPLQKRRLTRIKSKKKTNHKKIAIVKKTAVLVEITNPDKIKQIQGVFENTNTQIIKLREIKDPIIEKKLKNTWKDVIMNQCSLFAEKLWEIVLIVLKED